MTDHTQLFDGPTQAAAHNASVYADMTLLRQLNERIIQMMEEGIAVEDAL